MVRPRIYKESKKRISLFLTDTARHWLEEMKKEAGADSLSDVIEKMARNKDKKEGKS